MAQYVVMEVYALDAEDQESALNAAKASSSHSDSVFVAADSLGGLLNPVHHADSQAAFGHVAPAPASEEE